MSTLLTLCAQQTVNRRPRRRNLIALATQWILNQMAATLQRTFLNAISLQKSVVLFIQISLKFVPPDWQWVTSPWRWTGYTPLLGPMWTQFTAILWGQYAMPQWVDSMPQWVDRVLTSADDAPEVLPVVIGLYDVGFDRTTVVAASTPPDIRRRRRVGLNVHTGWGPWRT